MPPKEQEATESPVPPKEQEATESPTLKPMKSPLPRLGPSIQSRLVIGWERGANDAAHAEVAPVTWEPEGHDLSRCDKVGACVACTSVVVESGHQHRMDGQPLPPKVDISC